jgi:dihydropteroate synthase
MASSVSRVVPVAPEAVAVARRAARYHARVLEVTDPPEVARELLATDCEPEGVGLMTPKARTLAIRLDHISLKAAPLLKQELLAVGGDSAHARGSADHSVTESSAVLLTTSAGLRRVLEKLERQPFRLSEIGQAASEAFVHYGRVRTEPLRGVHRPVPLGPATRVMGVLNVTPDSFSDGGRFEDPARAVERAAEIEREGAEILDLGAESTRPGAAEVSPEAEWKRLAPVLSRVHATAQIAISVDTRHAEVARLALDAGADLINDVSGFRDVEMRRLLARTGAPAVLMHMRGVPETMQRDVAYRDVRAEVYAALADSAAAAVEEGVAPDQLAIDPGLGFGKSADQNLVLLGHLGEFRSLGYPVVVGASRKSFLGDATDPAQRLEAGLAAAVIAAREGAAYVRTHDVRPTVRALAWVDRVRRASSSVPSG